MSKCWQLGKPEGELNYCIEKSPFGRMLLAWNSLGLCYLGFTDSLDDLKQRWPKATLIAAANTCGDVLQKAPPLALYGTAFEHSVWRALLDIPSGETCSYSDIAKAIGKPTAQRAVASAIGRNPISLIIPCHRVVRATGELGGYHWGLDIKRQILDKELNT